MKTGGRIQRILWAFAAFLVASCTPESSPSDWAVRQGAMDHKYAVAVEVKLDGEPLQGANVVQGGSTEQVMTDEKGQATVWMNPSVPGDQFILALHPEARTAGAYVDESTETAQIFLERYPTEDNQEYEFKAPGEPGNSLVVWECGHCHESINESFTESVHAQAGSNPVLYDVYLGRGVLGGDAEACEAKGGVWTTGPAPGGFGEEERCIIDPAVQSFGTNGECANCHTPGINGALGGRDLMEAEGTAYESGVHCDVCHHVESVDLEAESPGVGGALQILRPSDKPFSVQLGEWKPLAFGPNGDNVNANMGSVRRDHFHEATLCAGCHELEQAEIAGPIAKERWPSGRIPVHSTYSEWAAGPMNPAAPCQSCHMPPNPEITNSADLQNFDPVTTGVVGGWVKDPGTTRHHSWPGPRTPGGKMLQLAAFLQVEKTLEEDEWRVRVTTRNAGPGHAIPSGEPMRNMILEVKATCDGADVPATGGDVVPDYGGYLEVREEDESWDVWPEAQPGDSLRVVHVDDQFRDYTGYGPFGDGTFTVEEKGLRLETYRGESRVIENQDGSLTLDPPLAEGNRIYHLRPQENGASPMAGAPGFGFARVLTSAEGKRMVPHYLAVDVVSDNRLLPQHEWTSEHRFEGACAEPVVTARLLYRAYPWKEAGRRGWVLEDQLMTEVRR